MHAGDPGAAEECIDRYGGLVWSLARRLLGARADVEDAVQEVYLQIWKNAGRFDPGRSSESTFVTMIARRRLIDRRRHIARRPDQESTVPFDDGDLLAPPNRQVEVAEEVAIAAEAIRQLRPDQQEILRLAVCEGWSRQQIADHMQIPIGTVKTHVRRGLMHVRGLIKGEVHTGSGAA